MSSGTELSRRAVLAGAAASGAVALGPLPSAAGMSASATQVIEAKRRLNAQGYYCGVANWSVDALTVCAVLAYQKANHMTPDGILDVAVMKALKTPHTPSRFTTSGNTVEVDVARQLLRIVSDGKVLATLHASTGTGSRSDLAGRTVVDRTPTGRFRLRPARETGTRTDSLGVQFRPHDFCPGGYAVYGLDSMASVRKPSTHGGVAVHSAALTWLEDRGHLPHGRLVLVV